MAQGKAAVTANAQALSLRGVATASGIAGAAVGLAGIAFSAAGVGVAGIGIAAAATVGYVAHSIAQHIGWIDKEQSFLDRLSAGWERLKGIISNTNVEWNQNEADLDAAFAKVKSENG